MYITQGVLLRLLQTQHRCIPQVNSTRLRNVISPKLKTLHINGRKIVQIRVVVGEASVKDKLPTLPLCANLDLEICE